MIGPLEDFQLRCGRVTGIGAAVRIKQGSVSEVMGKHLAIIAIAGEPCVCASRGVPQFALHCAALALKGEVTGHGRV